MRLNLAGGGVAHCGGVPDQQLADSQLGAEHVHKSRARVRDRGVLRDGRRPVRSRQYTRVERMEQMRAEGSVRGGRSDWHRRGERPAQLRGGQEREYRQGVQHSQQGERAGGGVGVGGVLNSLGGAPPTRPLCMNPCSWESWVFTTLVAPAFGTFVPLMYCTTHLNGPNPDGCVPNEGSTSEVVNGHQVSSGNLV
eukprot:5158271-Pyramimonas_sp.AAC.2